MLAFTLRRLAASALLLFLVLSATFLLVHLAPGEPTALFQDPRITAEARDNLRQVYGLDRPIGEQYLTWLSSVVLRGDWGISIGNQRPVAEVLLERLPNTVLLAVVALLLEHLLGLPLGVIAARRAGSGLDQVIRVVSLVFYSMPAFWLALFSIELLTVRWTLFPTNQMRSDGADALPPLAQAIDLAHHLVLPASILAATRFGAVMRFARNGMLEILSQDYIRTAYAKGLSPARVLWVHALPNALVPIAQRLGVNLPILLSGSLVIEVIFSWPGVGWTVFVAILQRDYPMILGSTALAGALVVFGSLIADLLHAWLDPRVRKD